VSDTKAGETYTAEEPATPPRPRRRLFLVLILLILLGLVLYQNRGKFIAAVVNGRPITRFELDGRMVARYGDATLEEMINEHLVKSEAQAKGVKTSPEEINSRLEEFTKQIGENTKLEDFLTQRGFTLEEFKKQIELDILVKKLTAGSVNISDQELADFISKNRASLTATSEADLKNEALEILSSRKRNETFQKWFQELKNKAKVQKFI